MALHLDAPVMGLPGIGPSAAADLKSLSIRTLADLLWHLPYRYDDFSLIRSIATLRHDDVVTVQGTVRTIQSRPSARNRRLTLVEAIVEDESGAVKVTWFNQPYLVKSLKSGSRVSLSGRVDGKFGLTLVNPVYEPLGVGTHTGRIVPVYGLSGTLTQRRVRTAIKSALPAAHEMEEWLPEEIVREEAFPSAADAITAVHFPDDRAGLDRAISRLKFEELFLHQLLFAEIRRDRETRTAHAFGINEGYLKTFVASLPFALTNAQRKAAWEIVQDCAKDRPMNRLLEGDVGSGKTAVAAIAVAHVLDAGGICAYLAPTEILAGQQVAALKRFLPEADIHLLTGSRKTVEVAELREDHPCIIVGTHALFQEGVALPPLGLVVIDEQHRFGVQQRHALIEGGDRAPHLLSMTATPIPRSLALTLYGDLDLSILNERPKGRRPVSTHLVLSRDKKWMWDSVRLQLKEGRQVYVVCPLIDPSDTSGAASATEAAKTLQAGELKSAKVGLLHGKMKSDEKVQTLAAFRDGTIQVLVATTVVEVGVDVPNATAIVIMGAERFGLAQLHQLRGRVGRSDFQSFCYLMPDAFTTNAQQRLLALTRIHDGFALAEKDLELRGAGNVFGDAQSGFPDFKLATPADVPLMKKARDWSARMLRQDPQFLSHPLIRKHVRRSLDRVHLE